MGSSKWGYIISIGTLLIVSLLVTTHEPPRRGLGFRGSFKGSFKGSLKGRSERFEKRAFNEGVPIGFSTRDHVASDTALNRSLRLLSRFSIQDHATSYRGSRMGF